MLNLKCFQLKAIFLPALGSECVLIFFCIYVFADEDPFLDCQGGALEPLCRGSPGSSNVSTSSTITAIMWSLQWPSVQFSSAAQSCPTLCYLMDCSTPGFPVQHQLPEFTQTQVHWIGEAIQPSHPRSFPSPPAFNLSQHQGLFKWVSYLQQVAKILEFQLQHQSFQWIFRTLNKYNSFGETWYTWNDTPFYSGTNCFLFVSIRSSM